MKRYVGAFMLIVLTVGVSQARIVSDTLVLVQGIITDKETNEPISATLTYEKLPYYDDIGIARSSSSTGHFRLHLVKSHQYSITVKADGYEHFSQNLLVTIYDGSLELERNFKLERNADAMDESLSLHNLIFARGRSTIAASSHGELDNLVRWMENHSGAVIQLEGHTDFEGNQAANLRLSLDRVEAVRKYVSDKGIQKKRILIRAYGGTQPLTRERTDEGRARNRRVEVQIIQN